MIKPLTSAHSMRGVYHLVNEVHNFYSRYDTALQLSNLEKVGREMITGLAEAFTGADRDTRWEQRLGLTHAPSLAPPNLMSHNAVTFTNRAIDRGDYFDAPQIAAKILQILQGELRC